MNLPDEFIRQLVEKANLNRHMIDGSTDSVKDILAQSDVVIGVWRDNDSPHGIGMHVIKGQRVLGQIMAGGERMNVQIDAIPCVSREQAIACQDVLGSTEAGRARL
jgi:hypothetical protein